MANKSTSSVLCEEVSKRISINSKLWAFVSTSVFLISLTGCEQQIRQFDQGFARGKTMAMNDPAANGEACGGVGADYHLEGPGCRVGFSSYRFGQYLKRNSYGIEYCAQYPSRVDRVLKEYWNYAPGLDNTRAARIVRTCEEGFVSHDADRANLDGILEMRLLMPQM